MKVTKGKSGTGEEPPNKIKKSNEDSKPKLTKVRKPKHTKNVDKRNQSKDRIHQLRIKIKQGDGEARKELEGLIKKLEVQTNNSRRSRRKLNMYKNILAPETTKTHKND